MKLTKEKEAYQKAYDRLDIYKVFELIDFEPHEGQKKMIEDIQDPTCNVYVGANSRRFGKTDVIASVGFSRLLLPFARVVLISKTFDNSKNLFDKVFNYVQKVGLKIIQQDTKKLSFTLDNGSKFTSASVKNIDSILGSEISTVIVDEASIIDCDVLEEIISRIVEPALAGFGVHKDTKVPYGELIYIGSPRKTRTYFHRQYLKGQDPKYPNYRSMLAPTEMNPYIPKEFIEQKRKELDPIIFKNEYGGEFDNSSNEAVFYNFDRDKNIKLYEDIVKYINKDSILIGGLDWGFSDSSSYVYIYVDSLGNFYVIDEYLRNKLGIGEHAKSIIKLEEKYVAKPSYRFADPAAALVNATVATDYNLYNQKAYNNIKESIDVINTLFKQQKLFICDTCQYTIETVEVLEWKDSKNKSKDPFKKLPSKLGHGDLVAALRYAVYSYWVMQTGAMDIISI